MRRDVFQAIADPTRRAILSLLTAGALTPNGIADHFDTTRQAVSNHIQILTECELLSKEKRGREIYYHFHPAKLKAIDEWLEQFKAMWDKRFSQLDDVLTSMNPENQK